MKRLILICIIFLSLFSTSAKQQKAGSSSPPDLRIKYPFPQKELPEIFEFENDRDFIIRTKAGARFHVPAEAFSDPAGALVKKVRVTTTIFLQKIDFLSMPIRLEIGGSFLESAGMFNIEATAEGKALSLKKPIKVEFPNLFPGNQFYVYHEENGNWRLDGHNHEKLYIDEKTRSVHSPDGKRISGFWEDKYLGCDTSRTRKISGTLLDLNSKPVANFLVINEITLEKAYSDDQGRFEISIPDGCEFSMARIHKRVAGQFRVIGKNERPEPLTISVSENSLFIGLKEIPKSIGIREYFVKELGLWNFDKVHTETTCIVGKIPDLNRPTNLYTIALKKNLFAFQEKTSSEFETKGFPGETHVLLGYSYPDSKGDFYLHLFKQIEIRHGKNKKCIEAVFDRTIKLNAESSGIRAEILRLTGLPEISYRAPR